MAYHVGKTKFAELVDLALEDVPEQFRGYLEEVRIEIADTPTRQQAASVGLKANGLLLGLYVGRPRTARSVMDSAVFPDAIWIFQDSIERTVSSEAELVDQVQKTVLHEIGHHFGLSENDLTELGYG